jgi:hypothetical protein
MAYLKNNSSSQPEIPAFINPAVRPLIKECRDKIVDFIGGKNLVSLALIGSAARNELSIKSENPLELYSDIEFLIVVNSTLSKNEIACLRELLNKETKTCAIKNQFFSIDFGICTLKKIYIMPVTLWASEVKVFSVILYGLDFTKYLRKPNINNFDLGSLNELLISRLWNLVISVPNKYLNGIESQKTLEYVNFSYARNTIDLLTILMPNLGILEFGYKNRLQLLFEKNCVVNETLKNIFKIATQLKLNPNGENLKVEKLDQNFHSAFISVVSIISNYNFDKNEKSHYFGPLLILSLVCETKIFKEKLIRRLRRKFIDFFVFKKFYKSTPKYLKVVAKDFIRPKIFAILFGLTQFIYLHRKGEFGAADRSLDEAIHISMELSLVSDKFINSGPSLNKFYYLRNQVLNFMTVWFYARMPSDVLKYQKIWNSHYE